jgi:futalosine hydrolase
MKVLLLAATPFETQLLRAQLGLVANACTEYCAEGGEVLEVSLLHAGIGMVNTAFQLGRYFALSQPDVALQVGIAGAFDTGPQIGDVVEVMEEIYPELGADSPGGYLRLAEMGFSHFMVGETRYEDCLQQPRAALAGFKQCRGVTVNRVSGEQEAIASLLARWQPHVESMEGAAFFQACLLSGVPFRQLRGISNLVEPRNKANWQMPRAIEALNIAVLDVLKKVSQNQLTL